MKDPILKKAQKRVKKKKKFFMHAMTMAGSSLFLIVLWQIINISDNTGMLIAVAAMALSVFIHYLTVWGIPGVTGDAEDWESSELEKEYLRLKRLEDTKKNLSNDEYLELRELERRTRDEDFV